jgi:hypothetical protein
VRHEPIRASDLRVRAVQWLWQGRVPLGALTVLAGEPGLGKSLLSILLAARLSRSELGDGGAALFLTAEDSREHTVLPRLLAAGADLQRVFFPPMARDGFERLIRLPDDIGCLSELVRQTGAKLLVVDPLVAHLPTQVNTWQDQSVRGALAPLAALAEEHQAAVLLIGHLNKGQGTDPLRRLGGSIGLPAAARSVLLLARDPDDPQGNGGNRRVLAHVKSNLGQLARSVAFAVEETSVSGEMVVASARLVETGESSYGPAELLVVEEAEPRSKLAEAEQLLRSELEQGRRAVIHLRSAAEQLGISATTLDRAKKKLGITSVKLDLNQWAWQLPGSDVTESESADA